MNRSDRPTWKEMYLARLGGFDGRRGDAGAAGIVRDAINVADEGDRVLNQRESLELGATKAERERCYWWAANIVAEAQKAFPPIDEQIVKKLRALLFDLEKGAPIP
jgi:hypothetical protein